jgi:hypothetical protein
VGRRPEKRDISEPGDITGGRPAISPSLEIWPKSLGLGSKEDQVNPTYLGLHWVLPSYSYLLYQRRAMMHHSSPTVLRDLESWNLSLRSAFFPLVLSITPSTVFGNAEERGRSARAWEIPMAAKILTL